MSTEMDDHWSRAELDELLHPPQHLYSVDPETGERTSPQDWTNPWGETTDLAYPYDNLPFTPPGGTGQQGPLYDQAITEHLRATGTEDDFCGANYERKMNPETGRMECMLKEGAGETTPSHQPCPAGLVREYPNNSVGTQGNCIKPGETGPGPGPGPGPDGPTAPTAESYDAFTGQWGKGEWGRPGWDPFLDVPEYQGPDRPDFGTFEYDAWQAPDEFRAPTMEEAQAAPGFQMRMEQGRKALEASAAAKGMSRSGQTYTDLMDYGQRMGELGYQDVYGRRLGEHRQRRGELERDYQTGYGTARDIYGIGRQNLADLYGYERQEARDRWAPQFAQWQKRQDYDQRRDELDYSRKWDEYKTAGRRAEMGDAKRRAWTRFGAFPESGAPGSYAWG
jgi:hypothetical protein